MSSNGKDLSIYHFSVLKMCMRECASVSVCISLLVFPFTSFILVIYMSSYSKHEKN